MRPREELEDQLDAIRRDAQGARARFDWDTVTMLERVAPRFEAELKHMGRWESGKVGRACHGPR